MFMLKYKLFRSKIVECRTLVHMDTSPTLCRQGYFGASLSSLPFIYAFDFLTVIFLHSATSRHIAYNIVLLGSVVIWLLLALYFFSRRSGSILSLKMSVEVLCVGDFIEFEKLSYSFQHTNFKYYFLRLLR